MPYNTEIKFPFACPTCGNPAQIYGGRFNVTEQITVRYRTCPHCQRDFCTNVNGTETFRHWVQRGSKGGRHKVEGLWASKTECWRGLLRAIFYDLKLDGAIDEDTLALVNLCKS